MKTRYLRTTDIAKAAGVHANTVRLYEQWGFLPPIPRSPAGYRRYTQEHLAQMQLARLALHGGWPGHAVRESAASLVRRAASGDLGGALAQAYDHLARVQAERAQAEAAADFLEKWAQGMTPEATSRPLPIKDVAALLDVSADALRNWERNGLIEVPRDPHNGYRRYGAPEIGRLRVIRMLGRAGYGQMAILRMLLALDKGHTTALREALDAPDPDESITYTSDRWLSTLADHEARARQIITHLEEMIRARRG